MMSPREIEQLYLATKVADLGCRYTPPSRLENLLFDAKSKGIFSLLGTSIQGREIGCIEIGKGKIKVLAWSQMHGDESTSTRALIDLYSFLTQNNLQSELVQSILMKYTLRIIFQLNPDGAQAYTRENALGFDLNRDAITLKQPESRILKQAIDEFKPDLCLNCHDQRSLYSLTSGINPPQISFLAPAVDKKLSLTPARLTAMKYIVSIQAFLRKYGFDRVGRYDESYCQDCFGDHIQAKDIPTILIESGHIIADDQREKSRYVVFLALFGALTQNLEQGSDAVVKNNYLNIPENQNILRDVVLKNVLYCGKTVDLGLQNRLVLDQGQLKTQTYIHDIVAPGGILGYETQDLNNEEILINSHENDFENKIIASIMLKKTGLLIKI